uniref:Uncharacterized protein n=1 Tax=Anguilla anguilla TaxID=7936 RepID=A0A0E9WD24_ANGAN
MLACWPTTNTTFKLLLLHQNICGLLNYISEIQIIDPHFTVPRSAFSPCLMLATLLTRRQTDCITLVHIQASPKLI